MTSITVLDDYMEVVIVVRGHTDTKVCAALSFMVQVFGQCLIDREIEADIDMDDDGYMKIGYQKLDAGLYGNEIDSKLDMLLTGFDMLESQFPDCINLVLTG